MKKLSQLALAGAVGLGLTCGGAFAQSSDQQSGNADRTMKSGQTMTVTGCLMRGASGSNGSSSSGSAANSEYMIKGDDGKTWGLRSSSSSVNLSDHLNHKVTVTGKMAGDGQSGSGSGNSGSSNSGSSNSGSAGSGSRNSASSSSNSGNLEVSDLKMLSTSCQ